MTVHVEWEHPNKGRVIEELCSEHEIEVVKALKTLGMGSSGRESNLGICWRCIYSGYPFRSWMDKIDMESDFNE